MKKITDHIKGSLITLGLSPLIFGGIVFTAIRYAASIAVNPRKALSIAYMVDQTANVDANGRIDETISARAARARNNKRPWGCVLCRLLDAVQSNHCANALKHDTHNPTKEP